MRWWWMVLCVLFVAGCNLKDAFTGNVRVVARAGEHELTVEQLARILAEWPSMPLRRDMAERWAHRWVEWTLLAHRLAANDSLLDSVTVLWARWPDVNEVLEQEYHRQLVAERVRLDSAMVDSAYAAGEQRVVDHILIRASPDMSSSGKEQARRRAEVLQAQLAAGGAWERANEENEDAAARAQGGSLGVIVRGQMVPPFEQVAFALEPGEVSQVVETRYGYHVVRRPILGEVRDELREAVEQELVQRMDSVFLRELEERWEMRVRSNAPALLREAARGPLAALRSNAVLGTYKDGKLTVAGFVRWLQALPPTVHMQIPAADDDQLNEFARSLMRKEVLRLEAEQAGVQVSPEIYAEFRFRLRRGISRVREALELDAALARADTPDERRRAVDEATERLLTRIANRTQPARFVPTFLADKLRSEHGWSVSDAGLDRVIERAASIRVELEPAAPDTTKDSVPTTEDQPQTSGSGDGR